MSETNRKRLFNLLKISSNNKCIDCGQSDPEWTSLTIGIFLCTNCAQIHRKLGSHISRVKSLKFDNWDQCSVLIMEENGNRAAKCHYEKFLPDYYRKPKTNDPEVLKEQWIRAKYERKEFMTPVDTVYSKPYMECYLMKKGKKAKKMEKRKFVVSRVDQTLKYFVKNNDKNPKAVLSIPEINVTFCHPKKIEQIKNPNTLQLTYIKDGLTRSIYVYSEDGKLLIDWYTAIRAAKFQHLQIAYPTSPVDELIPHLTRDFIKEGYLWKTGPKIGDSYKKRWFTLDYRNLMYLENPLDPYPKGEIYLGEKGKNYAVLSGILPGLREYKFGFLLKTPERTWLFGAESEDERKSWITSILSVLETPVTPHDCSVYLRTNSRNFYSHKKKRNSDANNNRSSASSFTGTVRKDKTKSFKKLVDDISNRPSTAKFQYQ